LNFLTPLVCRYVVTYDSKHHLDEKVRISFPWLVDDILCEIKKEKVAIRKAEKEEEEKAKLEAQARKAAEKRARKEQEKLKQHEQPQASE